MGVLTLLYGWDETTPKGTDPVNVVDNRIREFKATFRQIMAVDHKMEASGDVSHFGKHIQASLIVKESSESVSSDSVSAVLFAQKNSADKQQLKFKNTAGTEFKLMTQADMIGMIAMWSGTLEALAAQKPGWAVCDGAVHNSISTPDLRDKFILGAGNDYANGATGGETEHELLVEELPEHTHRLKHSAQYGDQGSHAPFGVIDSSSPDGEDTMDGYPTGEGTAHNNMPPYYALFFIMYVGD